MSDLTKCVCGHEIAYHSEDGCEAYVHPKIGGSGVCCTRTPEDIVRGLVQAAERERFPDRPRGDGTMSELTEGEQWELRSALREYKDPGSPDPEGAVFAAVERIIAARTRAVEQERDDYKAKYAELNNALSWETTCLNCSNMLTKSYEDYAKREQLEAAVLALADECRYKGEFGFGPWQEGHGPDLEGTVLDECSSRLRALVSDPTALDRVRQEAVEAALALIEEVLSRQEEWARAAVLNISGRVGEERRTSGKATLMNIEEVRTALAIAREATAR